MSKASPTSTDHLINALKKVQDLAEWGDGRTTLDARECAALMKYIETLQK